MKVERQEEIMKILKERKMCSVTDLCELIYASPATIRRDINDLEEKGLVRSFYGGVSIIEKNMEVLFDERKVVYEEEKKLIANLALRLVQDDTFVSLDSSTTCLTLGRKFVNHKNVRILTNGLETLSALHKILHSPIYSTGGKLNTYTTSMLGNNAHEQIKNYYTDLFFCSCRGITELGSYEISEEEAQIKRYFSTYSSKTVLLVDDSKFNMTHPHNALTFDKIDFIISNKALPKNIIDSIMIMNPRIHLIYEK